MCDWRMIDYQTHQIEAAIHSGQKAARPFHVLAWSDDPDLQLRTAQTYCKSLYPASDELGSIRSDYGHAKLKIGYYSADFHNHATAVLMAELFESHDGTKFEIYGFSFGPNVDDDMRKRVAGAFTQFIDVSRLSDAEVAQLSRELEIDIAIDLKGYTHDCRTGIFSYRCAPIQVNYLGYPGTMGAPYMDYILADHTLIPPALERHYSEKVIRLPHSYQVNDSKRSISDRVFNKQELGLPEEGFVFCCFNNNYKILPGTFDCWMRLLNAVDGSVLWLLADNPTVVQNLQEEARRRGVEPSRIVFAPRMPLDEHLARHRLADLFIDTFPCNAHTTASDALWAGLPVLTLMGQSFASRVAASLLNALNLPELIVQSPQDYEKTALELALHPEYLAQIKVKLQRARNESPLFKGASFAKQLESAFEEMHRQHLLTL
jgi:predicted O-linked N-acetylglucosamine transferase (SPINDLY family)